MENLKSFWQKWKSNIIVVIGCLLFIGQSVHNDNQTKKIVEQSLNKMQNSVSEELIEMRLRMNKYAQEIDGVRRIILLSSTLDKESAHSIAEKIVEVAHRYESISVSLLTSVIYTESHFYKDTVSHAGAMGLGQLMPETVVWICREWNLPYHKDIAFNYEINIKMTAWYLDWLYNNAPITEENIERTLAYYNGGGRQAYRWGLYRKQLNGVTLDSLEAYYAGILYEETKQYVIKVMDRDSLFRKRIDTMLPTG